MIHLSASIPVISPIFQGILDAIGAVLAWIYDLIPNYGLSIIVLTILVRLVLLPLGVKQIKSMHNMQALQPKIKALQTKYKGNKQKQQEEIMKLYRESGVNPLSGCWPVLLQFPILIAMYAVLRPPILSADANKPGETVTAANYSNNHLPADSSLFVSVTTHQRTDFLTMNLQCSGLQAGSGDIELTDSSGKPLVEGLRDPQGNAIPPTLDCGDSWPVKIPYFAFLLLMVGTTFYQQRQMQKVSPPGATNPQQQALFKIMPLMFGVFGVSFPAGLVVYWTTSNAWQIGQQYTMLRLGHIGPEAQAAPPKPKKARPGLLSGIMQRADEARNQRNGQGKGSSKGSPPSSKRAPKGGDKPPPKKPSGGSGQPGSGSGSSSSKPNDGGSSARSRKKRPKR